MTTEEEEEEVVVTAGEDKEEAKDKLGASEIDSKVILMGHEIVKLL